MFDTLTLVLSMLLTFILSIFVGYFIRVWHHDKSLKKAQNQVEKLIEEGKREASKIKKETVFETKQELFQLKKDQEKDIRERRQVVINLENKSSKREDALNNRSVYLDKREETISNKEVKLEEKKQHLDKLNGVPSIEKHFDNFKTLIKDRGSHFGKDGNIQVAEWVYQRIKHEL